MCVFVGVCFAEVVKGAKMKGIYLYINIYTFLFTLKNFGRREAWPGHRISRRATTTTVHVRVNGIRQRGPNACFLLFAHAPVW